MNKKIGICLDKGTMSDYEELERILKTAAFKTAVEETCSNPNGMSNFIDLLGLKQFNICENQRADVDEEYKKRVGTPAMSIPILTFDFDF